MYAEKNVHRHGKIARETPEHVRRIQLRGYIAVVEHEILLVGGEKCSRTEYGADALHHSALVAYLGVGQRPVCGHPWPERVVVIGRHVGYLRIEDGRTEGGSGIFFRENPGAVGAGHAIEYGERFAECLGARIGDHVVAAVEIHIVVSLLVAPELVVDCLGQGVGTRVVFLCLGVFAHKAGNLCERAPCLRVDYRGSQRLALSDIGRLHPAGIALLAPVDERCLASNQPRLGVVDGLVVVLKRILDYGIDPVEPALVARSLVYLECGDAPYLSVGADGPRTSGARILHDAAVGGDFMFERYARHLGLQGGHSEDYGVAHVARPYSGPFLAGAEGPVRLNGVHHLVEAHIEYGVVEGIGCGELRIFRNIVLEIPFFLHPHVVAGLRRVVGYYPERGRCVCLERALDYRVAGPAVGLCSNNIGAGCDPGKQDGDGNGVTRREGRIEPIQD